MIVDYDVQRLHVLVVRPTTALGRNPGNDFIRVHNIAGFAVDTVRRVQMNLRLPIFAFNHLVNRCGTEVPAGIAILDGAALVADVRVGNDQM